MREIKNMKVFLLAIFWLMPTIVLAQYPKPITLTVTKITRERKPTPACDNCGYVTTIEAHSTTASFILVCESRIFPKHPQNNSVCAQLETGAYEVRMLEADLITFWPEKSTSERGAYHEDYSVIVEEARTGEQLGRVAVVWGH
jgi:hypothetical protein